MNKSILIIGTPRSGTGSLSIAFNSQFGSNTIYGTNSTREPWNYNSPNVRLNDTSTDWTKTPYDLDLIKEGNVILKTQSHQKPKHYPGSSIDFLLELVEKFDKKRIIIICRKDFDNHMLSFTNLRHNIFKYGYWTGRQNLPWKHSDIPNSYLENKEEQESNFKLLTEYRKLLFEISDKLNINVTWYEDLYGQDRNKSLEIIKSWNLGINNTKLNEELDPKFKYDRTNMMTII